MPTPISYTCTKCSLEGSTMGAWGKFYYKFKGKDLPINRATAICHSCNSIEPIEVLPSKDLNPYKLTSEEIEVFLEERESPARCLNCGDHDHEKIPDVERDKEREKLGLPYRTGIRHRGCGGRIYADFSGANLCMGNRNPRECKSNSV